MPTAEPFPGKRLTREREREIRELLGLQESCLEYELAEVLDCSQRTVQRLDLPYRVIGGRRFYDLRAAAERLRTQREREGEAPPLMHGRRLQREREAADEEADAPAGSGLA
jgi:hypothetical protein